MMMMIMVTHLQVMKELRGELVVDVGRHFEVAPAAVPLGRARGHAARVDPDGVGQVNAVWGGHHHHVGLVVSHVVADVFASGVQLLGARREVFQGGIEDQGRVGQNRGSDEDHAWRSTGFRKAVYRSIFFAVVVGLREKLMIFFMK